MEAYFAGGCFWCMEKPYDRLAGVRHAESGYCGGSEEDASYEKVKHQLTEHRETVRIVFDETEITFDELLKVYFYNIDPFDGGGQFIDRGHSYTCAVYCVDDGQRASVLNAIGRIERESGKKVCVSVEKFSTFYPAEEYHQKYAERNPEAYREEYELSGRASRDERERVKL